MSRQSTAMKLILDELEEPTHIYSLEDRIRLQKVVYLVQSIGIDLGYSYGWYVRGPYSSSLADDYYDMPNEDAIKARTLKDSARQRLKPLAGLIGSKHKPIELSKTEWLELVASVRFLEREARLAPEAVERKIQQTKAKLYPYLAQAHKALKGLDGAYAE